MALFSSAPPPAPTARTHWSTRLVSLAAALIVTGCADDGGEPLFRLLTPEETGVTFVNTITESDSLNVQTEIYIYNGAGVAAGDIDDDGLVDLYFTGNMVSSRLYRNLGGMRFEDITDRAGVGTSRWATGASMVDINADGHLDIYVSVSGLGSSTPEERTNLLFVNDGDGTFTEAAARFGIADQGFTIHGAFLDYDRDGCLDLFLLNNSPKDFSRAEAARHPAGARAETPDSHNQLYRNGCEGRFMRVSDEAGILRSVGHGLGIAVGDVNRDGWPDMYISNDITPNDVLYVNNRDGTFTDKAAAWVKHASFAGMGVDIADFNNDGWPDILQADMLPRDLAVRKRMSGFLTYGGMLESRGRGFREDYSVNTLQLSNGVTPEGDVIFSEIARLAGVEATDWSWSALFADFDNDGRRDIFISNGYPKAINDFDYRNAIGDARQRGDPAAVRRAELEVVRALHGYRTANHLFRNDGDLTFTDVSERWAASDPGFSYGAAYADLDNDGRLDLVVNNSDVPAFIYRNVGAASEPRHFLQVTLDGEPPNRGGIGAKVTVTVGGRKQYADHSPYRGYMSTMDDRLHFGLGSAARVDSVEVIWPDGRYQLLTNVEVNQRLTVRQGDAREVRPTAEGDERGGHFTRLDPPRAPPYLHDAGTQVDYSVQPLLPYMISRQGPPLAVGDANGDGLDDLFIGGGLGIAGRLFLQRPDCSFVASEDDQPWTADKAFEDWGALFFDANGDGLLDLYVASGGYQLAPSSALLQDRLYINRGGGRFARDANALPAMLTSTAAVRAGDFTGDGRPDLFVGGRLTPRSYPFPARSYLLRNEAGRFVDVTKEVAPELVNPGGMITDAAWLDYDGDARLDLVTVGEWMPIGFYRNDGRRLREETRATGLPPLRGWWYSLATGDFDGDGRTDLVAGNLGLNHSYTTSPESPFGIYAADFIGHQTIDVVLTKEIDGTEHTIYGLVPLGREMYPLALKYPTYEAFSLAPLRALFSEAQLERAVHHEADTFASTLLRNRGDGRFSATSLPDAAQIAPVRGIVVQDVDGDSHLDLVVAGNIYDVEPNTPRADAGNGLWLRGDGRGHFTPVAPTQSGLVAPLSVSGLTLIDTPLGKVVLVANTGDSLQAFALRKR